MLVHPGGHFVEALGRGEVLLRRHVVVVMHPFGRLHRVEEGAERGVLTGLKLQDGPQVFGHVLAHLGRVEVVVMRPGRVSGGRGRRRRGLRDSAPRHGGEGDDAREERAAADG